MPPVINSNEFLESVRRSGVLDDKALDTFVQENYPDGNLPEKSGELTEALIDKGLMTKFQVELLQKNPQQKLFINGKYKLLDRLGAGGMGMVFLAEHKVMRRKVAMKVLPASFAKDQSAVERFHREARACAALDHPNIVRAHDVDQDGKMHFLVIEYVEGASLHDIIRDEGPMDIRKAADCIRQAALGLQHAHESGLVHRDIKPANLMVTRGPAGAADRPATVKILDFGLARLVSELRPGGTLTEDGSVMGTADYMAPEQANDPHHADIRADVYSLGCVLYQLLAGQPPFPTGSWIQRLRAHQTESPRPLTALRPDVPAPVARVVEKMMAKDPAQRYQTPLEVAQALPTQELLTRWQNEQATLAGPAHPGAPPPDRPATRSRRRLLVAAGVLLALAALAYGFGGTVIRYATNKGELVVEVDNPDVEVKVVQGGVAVTDKTTNRRFELTAGGGEVEVYEPASGLRLTTKKFTLTRGQKVIVNVSHEVAQARAIRPAATEQDLAGDWNGGTGDWGSMTIRADADGYTGTYTGGTTDGKPGTFRFKKSGPETYAGEWWQSDKKHHGPLELEVSRDRRHFIVSWKSETDPAYHGLSHWKQIKADVPARAPDDLSGLWDGGRGVWGKVLLIATTEGYTGIFTEGSSDGYPGRIRFKKSGPEAFVGEWWETDRKRQGSVEIDVVRGGQRLLVGYDVKAGEGAGHRFSNPWTRLD